MTEEQLTRWVEGYGRAWEGRAPRAAMVLFADGAEYYETPFAPPYRGREGVRDYWRDATRSQRDIAFRHEVLAVRGSTGIVRWAADFRRVPAGHRVRLDGILVLTFDPEGLCRTLREWWHVSDAAEGETVETAEAGPGP